MENKSDGKIYRQSIEGAVLEAIKKLYPTSRDIEVNLRKVVFLKTVSEPYSDDSGGIRDMVADFVNRMDCSVDITIDHKRGKP